MRVLLINPNRYKSPPVPPIGLEYIASSLALAGHEAVITDLCYSEAPLHDIDQVIMTFSPHIVGITVRNVDTVLFYNNEFFLDEMRDFVSHIKEQHRRSVIIGGTGVLTNPEGVLSYIGADYAVIGPGEGIIGPCLDSIMDPGNQQRIFHGRVAAGIICGRSTTGINYGKYIEHGGIAGVETHKGCSSSCIYCLEAHSPVTFRDPECITREMREIVEQGHTHFHLCDAEFNEDLDFSLEVCAAMKKAGFTIQWATYMKPSNYNRKLFREMKDTGAYLITLTVDSWKKCPLYWSDIEKIVFHTKSAGIRIVVDFLAGFPHEQEDTLSWCFDFFRRIQPDSVNVNTHIRLYSSLEISRIIFADENLKKNLMGACEDTSLIHPVFYNQVARERLAALMGNDPLFRIEGLKKGVNYMQPAGSS